MSESEERISNRKKKPRVLNSDSESSSNDNDENSVSSNLSELNDDRLSNSAAAPFKIENKITLQLKISSPWKPNNDSNHYTTKSVRSSSSGNSSSDSEPENYNNSSPVKKNHVNKRFASDTDNESAATSSGSDQRICRKTSLYSSSDFNSRKTDNPIKTSSITRKDVSSTENESSTSISNSKNSNKKSPSSTKSNSDSERSINVKNSNFIDTISKVVSKDKVEPKLKRYKLLSEDDLSDGGSDQKLAQNRSDCSSCNSNASESTKKRMKKKKLQRLNDMKRKVMEEIRSASKSCSDSESENDQCSSRMFKLKPTKRKRNKIVKENKHRSDSSCRSDSENETKFIKESSKLNKRSKQKQQKVDPMLEIKSKTQKLIREGRIVLPYHQPKKHSLDEFLQRRKNKLSVPIKASLNILNSIDKSLLKREEELVEFYKSQSEHSDQENDNTTVLTTNSTVVSKHLDLELNKLEGEPTGNYLCPTDVTPDVENTISNSSLEGTENVEIMQPNASESGQIMQSNSSESNQIMQPNFSESDQIMQPNASESGQIMQPNNSESGQNMRNLDSDSYFVTKSRTEPNSSEHTSCDTISLNRKSEISESTETNTNSATLSQMSVEPQQNVEDGANNISTSADVTVKNNTALQDSENFELILRDSIDEATVIKPTSGQLEETQIYETHDTLTKNKNKNDLRSKKLALLSRLNVPIRPNVGLDVNMGDVIQLDGDDILPKSTIFDFMEKFVTHVSVNKSKMASKNKLSLVTTDENSQDGMISVEKEIVEFEEESKIKPGSKYIRFKTNMLKTIITKKEADWETYQSKKENLFETREPIDGDSRNIDTSDKPNFEPYHPEEELDDDELAEDDIIFKEKKLKKNDFVDDEAEVSYDEEENINDADVEDEDDDDEEDEEDDEENDDEDINIDFEDEVKNDSMEEKVLNVENDENGDPEMRLSENEDEEDTLSLKLNDSNFKKPETQKISQIFKYNTTSDELENKVLGLESIAQTNAGFSQITNSQIFELCSGKFKTQPDQLDTSIASDSENMLDSQSVEDSQNFNLTLTDTNDELVSEKAANNGYSAIDTTNREAILATAVTKVSLKPCPLFLSDDESDAEELFAKKRKSMRIQDSDDETDTVADPVNGKENEADDSSDMLENEEDELDEELAYNSEEEVIVKEKAQEFFDQEAELSESEWGSEDENEKGLDELEKEAGDDDDIDQEKLKDDLGRIHMRQMLDDDQNDVRMLQEFLLEDGELHSESKRERKFQWNNSNDNGVWNMKDSDDERPLNEVDETDESWRKIRHEREMYIAQQEKKKDLLFDADEVDNNSVLLAKNFRLNPSTVPSRNLMTQRSPNMKLSCQSKVICGSFLAKGKLLNRLAVTTSEMKDNNVIGRGKNHRNFVFGTISPEKKLPPNVPLAEKIEKRKIPILTSATSKRIKLANGSHVAVKTRFLAQLALTD